MAAELTMPKLSDSMAEAIIVRWLKSPGDAFTRGEALIEVETDKATVVYEAEADGTLDTILVPEGGTAAVGQLIATLGTAPAPQPRPEPARRREASAERDAGRAADRGRARRLAPRPRRHGPGRPDHARRRAAGGRLRAALPRSPPRRRAAARSEPSS